MALTRDDKNWLLDLAEFIVKILGGTEDQEFFQEHRDEFLEDQ